MKTCEFMCGDCGRSVRAKLDTAIERVEAGRTKCQYCRGDLEIPVEVAAALAAKAEADGLLGNDELLTYSCPKCERDMARPLGALVGLVRNGRSGCQVCGTELVFPPEVHAACEQIDARAAAKVDAETKEKPFHTLSDADSPPGSVQFACGACGASKREPNAHAGLERRCECGQVFVVPRPGGAPTTPTPGVPKTLGPTRASIARRLLKTTGDGLKAKARLSFTCESCDKTVTKKELVKTRITRCPSCRKKRWTLKLEVSLSGPGDTGMDPTLAAGFAMAGALGASLAMVGAGIPGSIKPGMHPSTNRGRMFGPVDSIHLREPGVSSSQLAAFLKDKEKTGKVPNSMLAFLEEREAEFQSQLLELLREEGVHCLICSRVFPPRSALIRRHLPSPGKFASDTVCSSKCERAEQRVSEGCKTCEKEFVAPTAPALATDWEPKAGHAGGWCSKKCMQDFERKRTCKGCRKTFVIPKPSAIAKRAKKPKSWHEQGYCSKSCLQNPESTKAPRRKKALSAAKTVSTRCGEGHTVEAPESHIGGLMLCPECGERLLVR